VNDPSIATANQSSCRCSNHNGLVAYPTDTVYGLGASMKNLGAIEKVFEVKGRPKGMALPLLVADKNNSRN